MNSEQKVQVCDATKMSSEMKAGPKKIIPSI